MQIGVLALQGAFIEHIDMLHKLGVETKEIRQQADFGPNLSGLIIPGGESTVINKLLQDLQLDQLIKTAIQNGLPVLGTCAGLILLAKNIENGSPSHLAVMDITVKRNAYGRQLGSFITKSTFADMPEVPMVFIRAPYIASAQNNVQILATIDNKIVAAKQKNVLVTAFHPELTSDTRVHKYFLSMVKQ